MSLLIVKVKKLVYKQCKCYNINTAQVKSFLELFGIGGLLVSSTQSKNSGLYFTMDLTLSVMVSKVTVKPSFMCKIFCLLNFWSTSPFSEDFFIATLQELELWGVLLQPRLGLKVAKFSNKCQKWQTFIHRIGSQSIYFIFVFKD